MIQRVTQAFRGLRHLDTPSLPASRGIPLAIAKNVNAVCIDLDDTLYPQSEFLQHAWAAVAKRSSELGCDGDKLHRLLTRESAKGSARGGIIDHAVATLSKAMVTPSVDTVRLTSELVTAFRAFTPQRLTPYDGVVDALGTLHTQVAVVLITDGNPAQQRAKLRACGLARYFDATIFSDDYGRECRKPSDRPFLEALDAVAAEPANAIMVGDNPSKDILGATRVGMPSIRVRTGEYRNDAHHPDALPFATVNSFGDAIRELEGHFRENRVMPRESSDARA